MTKIVNERPLTLQEVRKLLETRDKEGELNLEQKTTLVYVKEFGKGKVESANKVVNALVELGIDEKTSVALFNTKPTTPELVRLFFEKSRFDLTDEVIKKIIEIVE